MVGVTAGNLQLRPGATAWQEDEHETVLLDLGRSSYLGVNPAGTLLWSMLAGGTTRDALVERLQAEYGLPAERAEHDVDAFLAQCAERGYLA